MMLPSKCTHIRIRDNNDYNINVDHFIKSVEKEHKIDFRSLPNWQELVQRLHVASTDCKRKIQDARLRKSFIIDKLYKQLTRPSPFELTAGLCRTASKWRQIENKCKQKKISVTLEHDETFLKEKSEDKELNEEQTETPHPNTEVLTSESPSAESEHMVSKANVEIQVGSSAETSHLPVTICTNPHKLISPLGSQSCEISFKSLFTGTETAIDSEIEEWLHFKATSSVFCTPTPITLTNNSLKQQSIQFSLTNCAGEYMHVRFKCVTDHSHFIKTKILPVIPKRLYPGIPVVYRLIFTLISQKEFKSGLYFILGRDVYDEAPPESLCIPIVSAFTKARSVTVSETISMTSVYPWHIKRNDMYSTGVVKISVDDPYTYHLHIYKRLVDLSRELDVVMSLQASGPNTESVIKRMDKDEDTKTIASSAKVENFENELQTMHIYETMALIAKDMVELALDTFIFESTYMYLQPYSKSKIPIYFTKVENIGYHQSYYDFELIDPKTENVVITKAIKVFAEVLAHPIQIQPVILDMSKSPVSHGYCEDHFVVSNTHKLYPVTIKIKLTTKMKKMFYVEPMEAVVPESSCVPFAVKFCSRDFLSVKPSEDLVHFTFKILVTGYKPVYENVPPFFYEVIAPCAKEFKKVYNEKYFKDDDSL